MFDKRADVRNFEFDKNANQVLYEFLTLATGMRESEFEHVPVLFEAAIESLLLDRLAPLVVVDATMGLGGHSSEIVKRLPPGSRYVGFDRDPANLAVARVRVTQAAQARTEADRPSLSFVESDFRNLESELSRAGIGGVDAILYDLGVSSAHYDDAERGFSFRFDGPLDMRFDRTGDSPTAADFLNRESEAEILRVLRDYGEEPKAYFVAKAVVAARKLRPFATTGDFLKVIEESSFDQKSKVRCFQAVRIAVNDEFGSVSDSLRQAVGLLNPGGRISVITFHSLEDRLVKQALKEFEKDVPDPFTGMPVVKASLRKVHKKPVEPTAEEIASNPRSRSAKLRVCEKVR